VKILAVKMKCPAIGLGKIEYALQKVQPCLVQLALEGRVGFDNWPTDMKGRFKKVLIQILLNIRLLSLSLPAFSSTELWQG